jgi:hypothetical protein
MKAVPTTKSIAPDLEKNVDILTAGALGFFNSIFRQLAIHQNVHSSADWNTQRAAVDKKIATPHPTIRQFKLMYHIR